MRTGQPTQHTRGRSREITDRPRLLVPVDAVAHGLTAFRAGGRAIPLRNPARQFNKINHYAMDCIARFVANSNAAERHGSQAVD
jgi:hypothetical protein